MHFEASDVAPATPLLPRASVAPGGASPPSGRFARVYDLATERGRRSPPAEVLDAVADAARALEELDAAGLQVRLDLTGGVSPELRDRNGSLVRSLTLREVVDPSTLLPPDAA